MTATSSQFNLVSLDPARCAHLIIDVQDCMCSDNPDKFEPIVNHINQNAISPMRAIGVQNIFVWMAGNQNTPPDFFRVNPQKGDMIVKKFWADAFDGTDLDATLKSKRVDTIIVSGFYYTACVLDTAISGTTQPKKYRVLVMPDCTDYCDGSRHFNRASRKLAEMGIAQVSSGEILQALSAGHKNGGKLAFIP